MSTKKTKLRTTYTPGDRVALRRDSAPKYAMEIMEKNPQYYMEIKEKSYTGYRVNVIDPRQNSRVIQVLDFATKCLTKGTVKEVLLKAIEAKQTLLKKTVEDLQSQIDEMSAQLDLMDKLGVEKIEEIDLEYAMRLSKNMNMSIEDAYKAIATQ